MGEICELDRLDDLGVRPFPADGPRESGLDLVFGKQLHPAIVARPATGPVGKASQPAAKVAKVAQVAKVALSLAAGAGGQR